MGLRIRGGRRGAIREKSSFNSHISARGRRLIFGSRSGNTNGSACTSETESALNNAFPISNAIERRKRDEALNQSIFKSLDHLKSVTEEDKFTQNIQLELENTVKDFDVSVLPCKSSFIDEDGMTGNMTLTNMEENGSQVPIDGVLRQVNGSLSKSMEDKERKSLPIMQSEKNHSVEISRKSLSEIQGVDSVSNKNKDADKNDDSSEKDGPCAAKSGFFYSKERQGNSSAKQSTNGPSKVLKNESNSKKICQGLNQRRIANMGQQKSYKYFNKLSKRNRINFYKMSSDWNPGINRVSKSSCKDVRNTQKAEADNNCVKNRRQLHEKCPKKYLSSPCSVSNNEMKSCPGTSTGNQVITSRDMSTLPMILRNSVMTQNSDSEKDDEEDVTESSIARNKNGGNEVIDVIDGIQFVTFENEHDMVQFTRLVSDESGRGDVSDLGFSTEFPEAIIPKKTKDIKKIKGWQKKKFTVTQNPMLDPNASGSEPPAINDLCPDSIEHEHNYMRRQLENEEEYTDCEDELPGLSMGISNFSVVRSDTIKMKDSLADRNKEEKISVWKPSEKSAFVSFSSANSDPLSTSMKHEETDSNGESVDAFTYQMKDPKKLSTEGHSEQQSHTNLPSIRSIVALSPTSILMNKIRRQKAMLKAKIIKHSKSVQVDLPFDGEGANLKRRYLSQKILEEELREWSQPFQDIWHVDEKRAVFAVSAVKPRSFLRGKSLPCFKNGGPCTSQTKLRFKRKKLSHQSSSELLSQRRLLRSSTKKKTPPARLTRSSINASKMEIPGTHTGSCTLKYYYHRKPVDTLASESLGSLVSASEKQLSGGTSSSHIASLQSQEPLDTSLSSEKAIFSTPPVDQSADETNNDSMPPSGSFQVSGSSSSKTLDSPTSSVVMEKAIEGSVVGLLSSNRPPQELKRTSWSRDTYEHRRSRKSRRKLIARKIWLIRRMRKLKEQGFLGSVFKGPLPCIADLGAEELRKFSHLENIKIKNGKVQTTTPICVWDEKVDNGMTGEECVELEESLPEIENFQEKNRDAVDTKSIGQKIIPPVSSYGKVKHGFSGKEFSLELENEELKVFLKPKPRIQVEALSPVKTSHESSMYGSCSSSKGEANNLFDLSPPRKTEVEIIKSKSPNSPALARKKLIRELQKLNANFVSVDPDERNIIQDNCSKEFCRLGCVCDSIKTDKRLIEHCGKVECMFSCVCPSSESSTSSTKHLIIGSDTVSRLQEESSRHMAKVEKYFHNTVVEAAGELVLPGRQQRERRLPKRFLDESIDPNALFINKKAKPMDSFSKVTGSQTKKACNSQSTPQYKKCTVSLGQFSNLQASVRCIYHSRLNCPCLHFRSPSGVPRNVAMKSTTKIREKQISASHGSAFSLSMRDIGILAQRVHKRLESTTQSSFLESPDQMSSVGVISEVQSINENVSENEEMEGKDVSDPNNAGEGSKSSCEKKVIIQEPQNKETPDLISDKDCYCRDVASDQFSEGDEHLHSVRTSGIDLWVSQLPLDKRVNQGIIRVKDLSGKIPNSSEDEPLTVQLLAESDPKVVPCLDDDVSKNISQVSEDEAKAVPRVEDGAPEVAVQVEDESLKGVPQVSMENSSSGADLSELVRQDDSMPLFRIVEVKSLAPSSFELDSTASTESDEKTAIVETETSVAISESCNTSELQTNMLAKVIPKKVNGRVGKYFQSLESFDLWLKSNRTMCGDLEKMCGKSLRPLPINSVIIMRWSYLNKLVECHSAHLWIRQRFSSNSGQSAHIFVTQKDRPPDVACVNFLDLEKKEALCAKIAILLKAAKMRDPKAMGCGILVSKGCFWEISGHIKFGKPKRKDLQELMPKNEPIAGNNSSVVIHNLQNVEASLHGNVVNEVGNPSSQKVHLSTSDMPQLPEVSARCPSSVMSSSVDINTLTLEGGRSAEGTSDSCLGSSSVVKVELDLETSTLSVLDSESGPSKSLNHKSTFDTGTGDYDFGKYSIKDRTGIMAAGGNEVLCNQPGSFILARRKSVATDRRSSILLTDSLLNLERIPGTLSDAFIKHKQIGKVGQGPQSPPPTSSGSSLEKYTAIESITSTPNPFKLGIFSQGLEPPSVILQSEDTEPSVLDQQELKQSSLDSPEKREDSYSKISPFENNKDISSPSKSSLNLNKTHDQSSLVLENANSNQETKNLSSAVMCAGVKPPVLIIDLNKLRQGQTVPSIKNKNTPVAIRVTEIKSLAQGFDSKPRIETSDKSSTVGNNSIPQLKGSPLPAILPASQQNPGLEKVLISKTLPKPYSVCKNPVVVTCPQMSSFGGVNMSSGPIHVNIITELNRTGKIKRKSASSDSKNLLNVTENGEKFISEKSGTQIKLLGKKLLPHNAEQRKSLVIQEENCNADHISSSKNGDPHVVNAEDGRKGKNGTSAEKLNIDIISRPVTQLDPTGSRPEEVTVSIDQSEVPSVSSNVPIDANGTPVSGGECTILEDLPKSSMKTRHKQKDSRNTSSSKKIKISSGLSETSRSLLSSFQGVSSHKETKEHGNATSQDTLSDVQISSQEDGNSSVRSVSEVEAEILTERETSQGLLTPSIGEVGELGGSAGLNSNTQEETPSITSGQVMAHSPVKSVPVASGIGEPSISKVGLKITEKQSGCSDETKSGTISMPSSSTLVTKIGKDEVSELKMSPEKEAILITHRRRFLNTPKSILPTKKPEDHSSISSIKDKFNLLLQHSASSSFGTSPSKAQSPKKVSTLSTKKALSPSAGKDISLSPKKAATQLTKNALTPPAGKDISLSPKKAATQLTKNDLTPPAGKDISLSPKKAETQLTKSALTPPAGKDISLSPKKAATQLTKNALTPSAGKDISLSPKKVATQLTKNALTPSAGKYFSLSPKKALTQLTPLNALTSSAEKDFTLSPKKASTQSTKKASTPYSGKDFSLSPKKAVTQLAKNALTSSAAKDFSLSPKKALTQLSMNALTPSAGKDFSLSSGKTLTVSSEMVLAQPVEKASSWYPNNASSDSTKSLKMNQGACNTLASPSQAEEATVSNSLSIFQDEGALGHIVHHSLPSRVAFMCKLKSPKELSSSPLVSAHSPKKDSNSSSSGERGDQDNYKDCKLPSPIKKAISPDPMAAVKKICLEVPKKQGSSQSTSTTESQPQQEVERASPPMTTPTPSPAYSDPAPLGNESSDPPSTSSVVSSSDKGEGSSLKNDVIWYRLDLNGDFDKLIAEETGFSTSSSKLISAVMIARTSNRTVRLAFDKKKNSEESQEFKKGIYAVPTASGSYVRIGPYMRNEPTGVKTLKKLGNHAYKVVPNLLKVEKDTQEVDGMLNSGSSEPKNGLTPVREQKNRDNTDMLPDVSPGVSNKITGEEVPMECEPLMNKAIDESLIHVETNKNTYKSSSKPWSLEKKHLNVPLKIPVLSLPRISVDMEKKVHNAVDEEKKLMEGMPPTKRLSVANSDSNAIKMDAKCDELDKRKCKAGETSIVKDTGDNSPVVHSANRLVKGKESINSLAIKEGSISSKFSKTSDAKLDHASSDESSLICGEAKNQASAPTIQVKDNAESSNVNSGSQVIKNNEPNQESLEENKCRDAVEEDKAPQNTETSESDECPKNDKMKMNQARESSTSSPTDTEGASAKGIVSGESKGAASRGGGNEKTPSEKSYGEHLSVIAQAMTEKEFNNLPEEQYESGYLIPSIPKLAPIPAKKYLVPAESPWVVIEDLGQPGAYVTFEGVDCISSYLNSLLHRHIRFFPADFKIEWTYFKNLPSTPAPGTIELKNLSKEMFITCKGVFRYSFEVETNSKQEKLLFTSADQVNPAVKIVKEIEEAKVQLLSLMVPRGDALQINCEKAIKKALGEISLLQSRNEYLSQSNVLEKKRNQHLEEKFNALLKALGVETFSDFVDKEIQMIISAKEELDRKNKAEKMPEDLGARGKISKRVRGKGSKRLETPGDTEPAANVICPKNETDSSHLKEDSMNKVSTEVVPSHKGRVLRSSKISNPPTVPSEKSDEPAPGKCLPNSSSSSTKRAASIKESLSEVVNCASPNIVRKLISPVADLNCANKSDSGCSKIKDSANASCSSERTSSQGETSPSEQAQPSSGEGRTVDALLWRKSFSQVKLDKGSLGSGDTGSSIENPTPIRQNTRKKVDQKVRASPRCLEASSSVLNPQTTNLLSKKRKS